MSLHNLSNEMERQLKALILDTTNNNPAPKWCTIYEIGSNGSYVNVILDGGQLNSVECFGYPVVGSKAVMVFMEGDINKPLVICNPMTMSKYEGTLKSYNNKLENGGFNKLKDNKFVNWTNGKISTNDPLIGTRCCEIPSKTTVTSGLVDISTLYADYIQNEERMIQVSLNWKGSQLKLHVLSSENKRITYSPKQFKNEKGDLITYNEEVLPSVNFWSYQQIFFEQAGNNNIKLEFVNESDKPAYIDKIRVWSMDSSTEWYPYDKNEVGLE